MKKVVICIATYNRIKGLERLLNSLRELKFNKCRDIDWQVVVVDNDSTKYPTKNIAEEFQLSFPVPLIFGEEPVRGIASARNKAIELAGDCDFIAFTDDDQIVDPLWLDELLAIQRKTDADIVSGPVISEFDKAPPKWISKGGFFQRRSYINGEELTNANTGNVLIKASWLKKFDPPFDLRFNLSGGSDSFLFRRLHSLGAKIVWAEDGVVKEQIPSERMSSRWILQRGFRLGNTDGICDRLIDGSIKNKLLRLAKNILKIIFGVLITPFSVFCGKARLIKSLRYIANGTGFILGRIGYRYMEYK